MKNKKALYLGMIVVGILILVLSLAADYIGIGGGSMGFGPRQIVGTIVGIVVAVAGLILRLRK